MKQDTDYKKKLLLLESAKKEFLEKGYNKASLRDICANAGVTTGSLYFFFENKAGLFSAIVDGPVRGLKKLLNDHFREDREYMSRICDIDKIDMDHDDVTDAIVDYIYSNYDSFMLILNASENTMYENTIDELVDMTQKSIPMMIDKMPGYKTDEYMCHWMAHISIESFINVIKHEKNVEVAKKRLRPIMNYLVQGWVTLTMIKEDKT